VQENNALNLNVKYDPFILLPKLHSLQNVSSLTSLDSLPINKQINVLVYILNITENNEKKMLFLEVSQHQKRIKIVIFREDSHRVRAQLQTKDYALLTIKKDVYANRKNYLFQKLL
jgi:DNA polymerase III alpha subunit